MNTLSAITSKQQLYDTIQHIHESGYELCRSSFNKRFRNAGNIGIFCKSEDEYDCLIKIRDDVSIPSENPRQKYFKLKEQFILPKTRDIPATTYSYLYIRKPDPTPYGEHRGDMDFYTDPEEFENLLHAVKRRTIPNAHIYIQAGIGEIVEMSSTSSDVLAYLSTKKITKLLRERQA